MYKRNVNQRMTAQGMMMQEACAVMNIMHSQFLDWKKKMLYLQLKPGHPTLDESRFLSQSRRLNLLRYFFKLGE